ncbi:MAG: hypothetical protein GX666_01235 [Tissierellia bacterium]|nr:hypothetical protein [Tissierellia bacterium]
MYLYLFIVLAIFGIGDVLGVLTKAKLSSVFVVMLLFLVGFLSGILPADIIDQAGLTQIGKWCTGFIVFHMGTMINMKQLMNEWRTVATSVLSMIVAIAGALIVIPIIGRESAIVSIPIVNGGIVATQIMVQAATDKGFALAAAMGTIVYAVQKFCGTPFASYFGTKEAELVVKEFRARELAVKEGRIEEVVVLPPSTFYEKNKKYFGNFTNLAITGFFAYVASLIGQVTGVSMSIWSLFLGAIVSQLGLVPPRIMDEAKASGLLNMAAFASIIPSLANISMQDLGSLTIQVIALFASMMVVLYIAFGILPLWKVVGSKNLALGISVAQLLGFPATYLIANEIAVAVAETEEEKEAILDVITPKYVVAGLATVTTLSILMAGIFEGLL